MRLFWCLLFIVPSVFAQSQYTTRIKNSDFNVSNEVVNIVEYQYNERRYEPEISMSTLKKESEWKFSKGYLFHETILNKGLEFQDISIYVYLPKRDLYSVSYRRLVKGEKTLESLSKQKLYKFNGLEFYFPEDVKVQQNSNTVLEVTYQFNGKSYGKKLSLKEDLVEQYNTTPYGPSIYKYNKEGLLVDAYFPGINGKKYTYSNKELKSYSVYASAFNKTKTYVYYEKDAKNHWNKKVEVDLDKKEVKAIRYWCRVLRYKDGMTSGNANYDINFIKKAIVKAQQNSIATSAKKAPSAFVGKYYYQKNKDNRFWLYDTNNKSITNSATQIAFAKSDYYMYDPSTKNVLKLVDYVNSSIDKPHPVEVVMKGQESFIHIDHDENVLFFFDGKVEKILDTKLTSINGKKFMMTPKGKKDTYWFLFDKSKIGVSKLNKLPSNPDNAYWGKTFSRDGSLKTDMLIIVDGEQPKIENFKILSEDGSILFSIGSKYYHVPYRASKVMDIYGLLPISKSEFDQLKSGIKPSDIRKNNIAVSSKITWKKNAANTEYFLYNDGIKKEGPTFWVKNDLYVYVAKDNKLYVLKNFKIETPNVTHNGGILDEEFKYGAWYKTENGGINAYNANGHHIKKTEIYKYASNGKDVILKGQGEAQTLFLENFKNAPVNTVFSAKLGSESKNSQPKNVLTQTELEISKCKSSQDIDKCVTNLFKKKHNALKTSGKSQSEIHKGIAMYLREIGKQFSPKVQCRVLMDSDVPNDKMASVTSFLTKEEREGIRKEAQKIVDDYVRSQNEQKKKN